MNSAVTPSLDFHAENIAGPCSSGGKPEWRSRGSGLAGAALHSHASESGQYHLYANVCHLANIIKGFRG